MNVQWQESDGRRFQADLSRGIDCSSTYGKVDSEPRAWHADPVQISPVRRDGWVGAVREGSPVNFFDVKLNPHGNGTHTECVGHISPEKQSVNDHLPPAWCRAYFIRLAPLQRGDDRVVSLRQLQDRELPYDFETLLVDVPQPFPKDFSGSNPPFFEAEFLAHLRQKGIYHFITNLPSVDPEEDGGELAAHRAFWRFPQMTDTARSITELAHFPSELREGPYLLNLQVAPLENDAAPSRPILYPLELV